MTYQYHCPKCGHEFDVVKSYLKMTDEERCSHCNTVSTRDFVPSRLFLNKTSVQHAEYNPGLGCIVRNEAHRKELCKIKGVEEIGNEKPESLHKYYDKKREEKLEQAWADVDKGWIGDGT